MTTRDDIEGDLVRVSAHVSELAVGGISEANMLLLRDAFAELHALMEQAEAMRPRLITESKPGRRTGTDC